MSAPKAILQLVEHFRENLDAYKSGTYNETQLRREFIDTFFDELGWDISNKAKYSEAYKDVVHEDAIKIGGSSKALFALASRRKYLENKKNYRITDGKKAELRVCRERMLHDV